MERKLILVTGSTGYVGGRLVPRLIEKGYRVRCLVRDPSRLEGRNWLDKVEVVQGDMLAPESLCGAMQGVQIVYYLVHSLSRGNNFSTRDLDAANNCAEVAKKCGVANIIYLGGLGNPGLKLSPHLISRHKTGEALRSTGVPVTEFRAAVIVGSGSISFEMVRYLTERLPVMICPRWVHTRIQPIAIRNVLDYLLATLECPASQGQIIEIGGTDIMTYASMIDVFAKVRGLKRTLLVLPMVSTRLFSYLVYFVTPITSEIAHHLGKGLGIEVIVRDNLATRLFPGIKILGYETAVRLALGKIEANGVETAWTDALISSQKENPVTLLSTHGLLIERRQRLVAAPIDAVFRSFSRIGGENGWLFMDWTWQLRGWMDRLIGGVGMRRGRRDPDFLRVGDSLDFWRVERVEENRLIRLRAEMIVPGRAWLEFEARQDPSGKTLLLQSAYFESRGLMGLLYWYSLYPIHAVIFSGLIRSIAEYAQAENQAPDGGLRNRGSTECLRSI